MYSGLWRAKSIRMPLATRTFLHALDFASLSHQFDNGLMIDAKELADLGMHARLTTALGFHFGLGASHLIHIGSWPADVADCTLELLITSHAFDLADDTGLAARLDRAALMGGDRAEGTTTEATTHDRDRVFDHFVSRNRFL